MNTILKNSSPGSVWCETIFCAHWHIDGLAPWGSISGSICDAVLKTWMQLRFAFQECKLDCSGSTLFFFSDRAH